MILVQEKRNSDVEIESYESPKGKFGGSDKLITIALKALRRPGEPRERFPFDFELAILPPGKIACPYHAHSAQWEFYFVVSGKGRIRDLDGWTNVAAGDAFIFGPGEAHQIANEGSEDFVYYVVADEPENESCHYPDSKKWLIHSGFGKRLVIKGEEVRYYDGEE
jgi:uncharacterized cupin superfamily protein